ncbi:uncharacterized protein [Cicer arietinum]|uniref:Glucan endo-1,3-beta-glucosidase 12 isoform X2 n=1 Tax=Cicer arietinum TaxID=3827 RepID=A0A1S2XVZ4_CICAR|nr:glucan endo-1,3-beta-glucosidase 12 isoform X2 [Cicer arietinum]
MAKKVSLCLLFLSFLIFFCSGNNAFSTSVGTKFHHKNRISKSQIWYLVTDHTNHQTIVQNRRVLQDINNSPTTTNPASVTPSTITPPDTPTIITVPSANPVTVSPTNPTPLPVTNPVTATPITVPGTQQPVNSYPPPSPPSSGTVPVTNPQFQPPPSNSNSQSQGSWCVAKTGIPQTTLQTALDYACGTKSVDCSQIQQGGNCYNPNSLQNHASFAFNSYYIKNPASTSCDFGGVATIVTTNPSSGTCIYPPSSGGAGTSGSGTTSPSTGFGPQSSPLDSSHSTGLRPFLGCMIMMTLLVSGRLVI